jgi:hypothetical protein
MPLNERDWASIYGAIEQSIPPSEVVYGRVLRVDKVRKLIWLAELGSTPIPIVGFRYTVTVYDEGATTTTRKTYHVEPDVPKVGDLAVVLRQMGTRRLAKCVGIVMSTGFVTGE